MSICVGMWMRWPASGTISRSWSPTRKARANLEIVGIGFEDLAHLLRVCLVPRRHVLDRLALGIPRGQRMDHRLLNRARLPGVQQRALHGVVGRRQRHLPAVRVIEMPG